MENNFWRNLWRIIFGKIYGEIIFGKIYGDFRNIFRARDKKSSIRIELS